MLLSSTLRDSENLTPSVLLSPLAECGQPASPGKLGRQGDKGSGAGSVTHDVLPETEGRISLNCRIFKLDCDSGGFPSVTVDQEILAS